MAKLKLTWDEYKAFANEAIEEAYPQAITDDSVQFTTIDTLSERSVAELPEFVIIELNADK